VTEVNRLFWDVESSPNVGTFWESGYKVRIPWQNIIKERAIICIAYKWEKSKKVSILSWDKGDDANLLKEFLEILDQADESVAHNGDRYDMKFFRSRCLKHGLTVPPDQKTVDTYQIARRRFKLNSYSLAYIAEYLGISKGKDPMEYTDWQDILFKNSQTKLRKMEKYCKQDVRLLEDVWKKLAPFHNMKTHAGVLNGSEKWSCQGCGSTHVHANKKKWTTKGTLSHEMLCNDCGRYYTIPHNSFLNYCEDKRG
jgi:hypothetical protein